MSPLRPPWALADGTVPFCSPLHWRGHDRVVFGPLAPRRGRHAAKARERVRVRERRASSSEFSSLTDD